MIEQTNSSIIYIADGVQTEWEYPYPYVENDDINLYITIDNVRTKISQDSFSFDSSTKKVTFPLVGEPVVSGAYVEISRETELTQLEDSSIVAFKSNDVERIADKLTMICQDTQRMVKDAISPEGGQIQEAVSEAISVHNSSSSSHPLKEDKANKVTSISGSSTDTEYPSAKAVNTELNKKQPKMLSETITVEGATETTVEGALTAINNNRANKSLSNLDENGENHFATPSFSNITNIGKQAIVNNVIMDYENVVSVDGITAGVYTQVAKDSFVVTWGSDAYLENYYVYVSPDNGTTKYVVGYRYDDENVQTEAVSFTFFVPKGWYFTNNVEGGYSARIYPLKGAQ